jgi:hypothetical protein
MKSTTLVRRKKIARQLFPFQGLNHFEAFRMMAEQATNLLQPMIPLLDYQ